MATRRGSGIDSPLITRSIPRLIELAAEFAAVGTAQIPGTDQLPADHFGPHLATSIVQAVTVVARSIAEESPIEADDVVAIVTPVIELAVEERIPLALVTRGYFAGMRRVWQEVTEQAASEDIDDLALISARYLDLLEHTITAMAGTYVDLAHPVRCGERDARRELSAALLHGRPVDELTVRADVTLCDEYDLLSIQVLDEGGRTPPAAELLARRRARLARELVDDLAGSSALYTFDGRAGFALLPPTSSADGTRYHEFASELTGRLEQPVVIVELHNVPRADLADATADISELAELARGIGRPAGSYTLDDLMLEYQLTRPGPARDRLASRITPLYAHPHLFEALRAHIRFGWNRKHAAAAVHLHPNSFSYRLRRVADLTGFDPTDPHDSRILAAALTVHELTTTPETSGAANPQ
ncbi:putative transcriptional regulator [Nocardia neocaledoniensis NBRC 108232]|uniref:DNA-binding PucR family transcriptional regulator n=1 Tax=Nocardia neocaledoniensis TaxID=236511 RepID=A0A317N737_9NOCA|nr:helix-turn-helix domain-containing protein [Nocardia neocaledoniensis]PWV71065.1 DNA-binding PucR family transcriptional regulator [Nocardia neocaledoniensis]GEM30266.1 putative transcriptional regulator [Nocardia neocaledoniensis NBRC 108232]